MLKIYRKDYKCLILGFENDYKCLLFEFFMLKMMICLWEPWVEMQFRSREVAEIVEKKLYV